MGTLNAVVVDDERVLAPALEIVQREIAAIDETCSRFREESELSELNRRAGRGSVRLSPLLEDALVAALRAADMTGGLVDPTVGRAVVEAGYSVTFGEVAQSGPALELEVRRVPGWTSLEYDPGAHAISLPADVSLDLGASGKAWAADRAAAAAARALDIALVVECGGDVAVAGPRRESGWPVRVASDVGAADYEDVEIYDGGLATSGTNLVAWRRGEVQLHHIIDPATGLPVGSPWMMVTVAAASCLEANAAATAALIMGAEAIRWLEQMTLPARLVDHHGVVRKTGGWGD